MKFSEVSCGYDYSMILSVDGSVFGCGSNFHGQLGIEVGIPLGAKYYDEPTTRREFTRACIYSSWIDIYSELQAKIDNVFQMSTGWTHTLLMTRYGLLGCGQSRDNALGLFKFIATDDLNYFMQVPIPGLIDYV
jgi:alpha-tubulin suppressor-like RCC1 family protein